MSRKLKAIDVGSEETLEAKIEKVMVKLANSLLNDSAPDKEFVDGIKVLNGYLAITGRGKQKPGDEDGDDSFTSMQESIERAGKRGG